MKKTLLSIFALAAMVVMVACNGTGKIVEKQVAALNAATAKLDSISTSEALNTFMVEMNDSQTAIKAEYGTSTPSEADAAKIQTAMDAFTAKMQAVATQIAEQEAAAAAAALAAAEAEAAAIAEAEAAAKKGGKKK